MQVANEKPATKDAPDAGSGASLADAVQACRRLAGNIGASGYGVFFIEARGLVPVFDNTFPGISPETRSLASAKAEQFVHQVAATNCPVWWKTENAGHFLSASARVWAIEVAPALGHVSGIAFPVFLESGRAGAVLFTGDTMSLDEVAVCDTHADCCDLLDQVMKLRSQQCENVPRPMSGRELECLRLTANGLTSEEIATALGLSVHTANQYLTNSTQKLNAVNRIHAVAKALRGGMIA